MCVYVHVYFYLYMKHLKLKQCRSNFLLEPQIYSHIHTNIIHVGATQTAHL